MSSIFGGSKSKQQSSSSSLNLAYPQINQDYGQTGAAAFNSGLGSLNSLLGGGFDAYKDQIGSDFTLNQGRDTILGNMAGRGALQSGAALKALSDYSGNQASTQYNNFLNLLGSQAQLGLGAGNLIGGAGSTSTSTSSGTSSSNSGGLGGFIGGALSMAPLLSDRRAKKDIEKIGVNEDGLNVYTFKYIFDDETVHTGVMAQEVAEIKPEALGPVVDGYMTVDYSKLGEIVNAQ